MYFKCALHGQIELSAYFRFTFVATRIFRSSQLCEPALSALMQSPSDLWIHTQCEHILIHASSCFQFFIYNAAIKCMVTPGSEISALCFHNWHSARYAKATRNKHCKWVSHVVKTTLLYDLSASRLFLSDLPIPSINLMMWQRARPIKLNYFYAH